MAVPDSVDSSSPEHPSDAPSLPSDGSSFSDLKEPETKALHELHLRIQLALQNREFSPPVAQNDEDENPKEDGTDSGVKEPQKGLDTVQETVADNAVECEVPTMEEAPEEATKEVMVQEDTNALEDPRLWGVPIVHAKGDERTDVILLKFLRARDFNVNEAFTMLKNTILWRKSFGADELLQEDLYTSLDCVAYMHGHDKQGHPVCYNVYGVFQDCDLYSEAFGDEAKISKFLRWRVRLLETGIQRLNFKPGGVAALVQITDLKNAPGPARKELRYASKQALSLLQDNYPEFVAKKVFINVPWYFSAIYSMFSPFLTHRTKSKFVVARRGKVSETLFKLISPDNVPVLYGGLSRSDDSEFNGTEAKCTELVVRAGAKETIEIPVLEAGSIVVWDLTVLGWNVTCGAEYVCNAADSYTTIIEKAKKMKPSEHAIRNSFKISEVGKVVLTIDNTLSRKKKVAAYRYIVKAPQEECFEIKC